MEYIILFEDRMFPDVEKMIIKPSLPKLLLWAIRKARHCRYIHIIPQKK